MENYGIMSLLPPVIAIVLAIKTRQVYLSLIVGIFSGYLVIENWNPVTGFFSTLASFVDVFKDAGSTKTILFSCLVGGLLALIQYSGGVEGFTNAVTRRIESSKSGEKKIQIYAWLTGLFLFIETNISILTVGTIFRPIFDKLKISREKLAYIADSGSAPVSVLIPFNAWGAFILGLIAAQGIENPFGTLLEVITLNFYAVIAVIIVALSIYFSKEFPAMEKANKRVIEKGKFLNEGSNPVVSTDVVMMDKKEGSKDKVYYMVTPVIVLVVMMPVILVYSGWSAEAAAKPGLFSKIQTALSSGSGSTAVMYSVVISIISALVIYFSEKLITIKESTDVLFKGMGGLIPLALLMLLAFAIGDVCGKLGTGDYVSQVAGSWLLPGFVPAVIFLLSAFIAFSTGTSWGTFAIMIAVAVPLAQNLDVHVPLTIAAVLGGGVFGDHCSPISDTTIVSSMASATDHIDHVRTQLPYAVTGGFIALVLYAILGFFI